jgi:serine/threonine protein kinase
MTKNSLADRKKRYFQLSSQIAQLDNAQLLALINNNEPSMGWGMNCTIQMGSSAVFVKRVPITDLEYHNLLSTKNLYELPTYYNYGIGSAGLGVFRELMAHLKTTHWVLDGAIDTFPLMYHYRIMPFSGWRVDVDMAQHQKYVEYWGNNTNIGNYVLGRTKANYELVLFLEYVPYVLATWLQERHGQCQQPLADLFKTVDFLRGQGIVHFDAHFNNVLTDGDRAYLTDFGLVLDRSFSLTKEEKKFYGQHVFYDYGLVLWNLGDVISLIYSSCSERDRIIITEKFNIAKDLKSHEVRSILLDNIEGLQTSGLVLLDDAYVAAIIKYRHIIALMQDFFGEMRSNNQKDTDFPDTKLQLLLEEAKVIRTEGKSRSLGG